jgi:hypothetical protein
MNYVVIYDTGHPVFDKYDDAFNYYENLDKPIKGVYSIHGKSFSGINVRCDFFGEEASLMDHYKRIAKKELWS